MNSPKLNKLQKCILGWLFVYEDYPSMLRWNEYYSPEINLRALRAKVINPHRQKLRITNPLRLKIIPSQRYFYKYRVSRSDSAQFSRAIRSLQTKGLVTCLRHRTPVTREQWVKAGKPDIRSRFRPSYQNATIKLLERAKDIAKDNLIIAMKQQLTVNKKTGVSKVFEGRKK
ncbi:hypothetical protein ES707_21462 [subsurface metagenome]